MFRSSLKRVMVWVERTLAPSEGLDAGPDDRAAGADGQAAAARAPHPHRRELRWERERRPGSVPRRPAHCISPVRPTAGSRTPHGTAH
jgi:hypothetical protein